MGYFPTYLFLHSHGHYVFRIRVPRDIINALGKTEIRRSVKTRSRTKALQRGIRMYEVMQAVFSEIRKGGNMAELSKTEINGLLDKWLKQELQEDEERRASRSEPKSYVEHDVPIQSIDRKRMNEFKQVLRKLPPNRNKLKKYRGKSIQQLIKMDIQKTLSESTINKQLTRIGILFDYAITNTFPNNALRGRILNDRFSRRSKGQDGGTHKKYETHGHFTRRSPADSECERRSELEIVVSLSCRYLVG